MTVSDVHTHILSREYVDLLAQHDAPLYGSDYPHNIGDLAGCLARVNALPSEVVEGVKHRNAERLFKL